MVPSVQDKPVAYPRENLIIIFTTLLLHLLLKVYDFMECQ